MIVKRRVITYFLLCFLFLFIPQVTLLAQTVKGFDPEDANEHFKHNNYLMALKVYKELLKKEPKNVLYNYRAGLCYLNTQINKSLAIPFLEFVTKQPKFEPDAWFELGRAYHYARRFDDAISSYTKYKDVAGPKIHERANRQIEMCNNGKQLVKYPVNVTYENVGKEINSEYPDYYPLITADEATLIFTSRRKSGAQLEVDGYFPSDIYISNVKNGAWLKARSIGTTINTRFDEQGTGLTTDGQNLIMYLDHIDSLGNIYICDFKKGSYQKPFKLNENVNSDFETSGAISADGQIIFFASERQGGFGETDIYMSRRLPTGQWALAQNLGKNINSKYKEDFPRLADDGKTLYFASQGHSSMGHFDLFKATWDEETNTWSNPTNLGYPVNTPDDNRCITFTSNNRVGYISTAREGGQGDLDIYRITFNDADQRLAIITGHLLKSDSTSKKDLDAMITVTNTKTNEEFTFKPTPATGKYVMGLPPGKYHVAIDATGYKSVADDIMIFDMGSFIPETSRDYQLLKGP